MGNYSLNKVDKDSGEITGTREIEIRVFPIAEPKGRTKGYASINIDRMFGVHGLAVIEGKNGLFVAMPQTKDNNNKFRDIFHPVTSEGREELNNVVLTEYAVALEELVAQKESALEKIREGARAAKERPAPDKDAAVADAVKKTRKIAAEH